VFQSFNAKALSFEQQQSPAQRPVDEFRELIDRYPNLGEIGLARLINLYRELSALDIALLLSDEKLAPNLDRFSADHRSKIRAPLRHYAPLMGYAIAGLVAIAWAMAFAS
jgi:hypothetical protein